MCAKWERKWTYRDNQEVGLEAAILERVRNSSLVEWSGTENVTGLKPAAEAVDDREGIRGGNPSSSLSW